MRKVKQIPHPLPPPILGVSVRLLILSGKDRGDNSIKSYHVYRKFPKFSDTGKIGCNHSKIRTKRLNHSVMHPNGEDRKAKSVDPDQTALLGTGSALFVQTYPSENL